MSDQAPSNKGKAPQVESDDEDEPQAVGADEPTTTETAGATKPSGPKKKKAKRKKAKEAPAGDSKLSADTNMASAVEGLSEKQVAELLALNPALAEEVAASKKTDGSASGAGESSASAAAEALKRLTLQDIMTGLASSGKNAKDMASYKFWQTQPVMKFGEAPPAEQNIEEGPLKIQTVADVPKEAAPLIEGFEWVTVDMTNDDEVKEVFELLYGHYVEDVSAMFRFNYSPAVLRWALMSPGWKKQWHVGVRASASRKLVAFIGAVPSTIRVRNKTLKASEVNFICVHKKLRGKRLAPVLIKEVTRLINLENIWQAIYTAGVVLPTPVSTCRYFHRPLDWQKLYEVGFSALPPGSKPQYQLRKYALPEQTSVKGLREMRASDVGTVRKLLSRYLERFELTPVYTVDEVRHWILPSESSKGTPDQVVWSYVVEDPNKKGTLTDFFSFYALESSVINSTRHSNVRAAYLFYYATDVAFRQPFDRAALKDRLNELVHDALILARRFRFDVFNAISLMDNALFLQQQKFGPGDGQLHYYLYNYRANPIAGGVDRRNMLDEEGLSGVGYVMM